MFYACVKKFDVTENLEIFCKILETKQTKKNKEASRYRGRGGLGGSIFKSVSTADQID
jgi:hypothetical protein